MNKLRLTINALAIVIFTLTVSSLAQAQATRTWVSGLGDDANPCSRTAPCKTFAGAISKTADGGEIDCIDPGGFGAVTITKSITIDGGGTFSSILGAGTNGINVNDSGSGAPNTKKVRLRNISINGAGTGINGINATSFGQLWVESCQIFGFQSSAASRGIRVAVTANGIKVNISDTYVGNNASGIDMSTTTGTMSFTVDRTRLQGMTDGLIAGTGANGLFRDSVSALNTGAGVKFTGGTSTVFMEHVLISQNGTGVQPIAGATAGYSNTTVVGNGTAISNTGGTNTGHGNNQFNLNGSQPVLPGNIGQQ